MRGEISTIFNSMVICGVYEIRNLVDNKVYVGSAIDIEYRWKQHRYVFKNNKHHNIFFQCAWNKHGAENFKFTILEETSEQLIRELETRYISKFGALNPKLGYNLISEGQLAVGNKNTKKWVCLINPEGELITHFGVSDFCRTYSMSPRALNELMRGVYGNWKGWKSLTFIYKDRKEYAKKRVAKIAKHYEVINPSGERIQIFNLNKFCRDNKLDNSSMTKVINGTNICYKGYKTIPELAREKNAYHTSIAKEYEVINPKGERIKFKNLYKFCKDNNLSKGSLQGVLKGRNYSYKGYMAIPELGRKLKPRGGVVKTYEFLTPEGTTIKITNLKDWCKQNNLCSTSMYSLANGKSNTYKGYTLPTPSC